jgi:hypothetical protein
MGNHRLAKLERLIMVSDPESKRFKVAALNLFHPTASPLFGKTAFSYCSTGSWEEGSYSQDNQIF